MTYYNDREQMKVRKRKKRFQWLEEDVDQLLVVWAKNFTVMDKAKRNRQIFEKMSDELEAVGVTVRTEEIRVKIKNLMQRWRNEKKLINSTGQSSEWDLFSAVDRVVRLIKRADSKCKDEGTHTSQDDELLSVSSDFEAVKLDPLKRYDNSTCGRTVNRADIERRSNVSNSDESIAEGHIEHIKIEALDLKTNRYNTLQSTGSPDEYQKEIEENKQQPHQQLEPPESRIEEPISSQNCEPQTHQTINFKKLKPKFYSKPKSKETINKLKQRKLLLEIENLKKNNLKLDLHIERAKLENRILRLKLKKHQRSFGCFS